jgi:hypothetical protein
MQPLMRREVMGEMRELIDSELEAVFGGVSDLGKYITKAVDDAISAAIGGNTGPAPWPIPRP